MAWHRIGDKPLSEPMLMQSMIHICSTRGRRIRMPQCWLFVRGIHQWQRFPHRGHSNVENDSMPWLHHGNNYLSLSDKIYCIDQCQTWVPEVVPVSSQTHFTNGLSGHNWNLGKFLSALILVQIIFSCHKLAHDMSGQLLKRVQNCDLIWLLIFMLQKYIYIFLWDLD